MLHESLMCMLTERLAESDGVELWRDIASGTCELEFNAAMGLGVLNTDRSRVSSLAFLFMKDELLVLELLEKSRLRLESSVS